MAWKRRTIDRVKPWLKSTGPRSALGKKRSSQNRLKHGLYTNTFAEERREFWAVIYALRPDKRERKRGREGDEEADMSQLVG